jgi:hypothetical protein
MAAPLRPTLAAGNVVLLGRIQSFNLRARVKDLLRRSVDVGLHDDDGLAYGAFRPLDTTRKNGEVC